MAATSLQIDSLPDSIRVKYERSDLNAVQMAREVPRQYQRNAEDVQLLKFPSTKNILWDHSETGESQTLHISYFRKPRLCITEKVLRFAQRHVESSNQTSCNCVLVGSLNIDGDSEGVLFNVERLDPQGDSDSSTSHAAGDMLIPFTIQTGSKERGSTSEDYSNALQLLQQRCCSKDPVELGNFLLTKGWCSFYTTGETCVHHLEFEVVTMGTEIQALPIGPVPIVPTALSKNLSGPMSISHMQGTPKTGYLTMDHTRKLLLVLESDPKVINLPLVGIWVSGVSYVYSPYVWACCLRYLHNSSIQDRVCSPPDPFLLVLYNPTHSKPEFYECSTSTGSNNMTFDFYTGYEAVQISKNSMGNNETIEVELNLIQEGHKFELFREAVLCSTSDSGLDVSKRSVSPDQISHDDITPRLKPAPHKSKMPVMQSMVPELSLFFGDDDTTFVPSVKHPQPAVPVSRVGVTQSSAPALPTGNTQNQPLRNCSAQYRQAPSAVSNYVNNAQSMRTTQSVNGNRSPTNIQVNLNQAVNHDSMASGQNIPPSYPSSVCGNYHQHGTNIQASNSGFSSQTGYIPVSGAPMASGARSAYCNCPSCPKPPLFYNRPQSYDMRVGPSPQVNRPVYSNYGPPPPRLGGLYPGYPLLQPRGFQHPQGPNPASQGYTQFSYDPLHSVPGSYPTSQVNGHHPSIPHSVSGETVQNIQMGKRLFPSTSQDEVPQSVYSNTVRPAAPQDHHLMKLATNAPVPQASGGVPVKAEENPIPPKTTAQSNELSASNSSEVRKSSPSSENSTRSSDDSGLSFTPEKNNSPLNPSLKSAQPAADLKSSLTSVNWENVPPEIYQLLMQQDKQLKQLQAQIEVLTLQQTQSLNNTAESTVNIKSVCAASVEKCTIATNTSVGLAEKAEQVSACMQTSQQEDCNLNHIAENKQLHGNLPQNSNRDHRDQSNSSSNGSGYDARTPAEIRHRGRLPMNSTQREDAELDISQGELVALMNNMHDRTIDSVQSEMIVDLPSFQSSPTRSPRSQESCTDSTAFNMSPRSPISASMCEHEQNGSESEYSDDGEEDNTAGTDNPEYYNRLMDNIKKLLSQNTTENTTDGDGGYSGDVSSDPSTPVKLAREEINLGEHLQSFFRFEPSSSKTQTDTTFIPKINYVSMFLDSDTDTSMEINAMAMKYLKDEQLTQLTKLQAKNRLLQGSKKTSEKTALLQKILKMEDDYTPNVTAVGMSPNDLTFATKKYLEKHGLIEGGASGGSTPVNEATQNDSYKLRTNYSTMTSGSDDGPAQVTQDILSTPSSTPLGRRSTDAIYSNGTTPLNENSRTPYNDSRQSVGFSRTPKPNPVQSRLDDHRRVTPNGSNAHNSSVPQSQKVSPFSQDSSPYTHDTSRDTGAIGRYVTPQITRPPNRPNHSPPERETPNVAIPHDLRQENKAFDTRRQDYYGKQMTAQHKQNFLEENEGVHNYYDSRQHRLEANDDDRILDITRLKQLPKLL